MSSERKEMAVAMEFPSVMGLVSFSDIRRVRSNHRPTPVDLVVPQSNAEAADGKGP
jgi:hypothetical protein